MSEAGTQAEWVECFDSDGTPYYFDSNSGKSTWHKPPAFHPKREASGDAVPPGWEIHYDDDGTPYFFNAELRKSTWSAPAGWNGPPHMRVSVDRASDSQPDGSGGSSAEGPAVGSNGRLAPYSAGAQHDPDRRGHRQTSSAQFAPTGRTTPERPTTDNSDAPPMQRMNSVRDRIAKFKQMEQEGRSPTPERAPGRPPSRHEKSNSALPSGATSLSLSRRERMQSMSNRILKNLDAMGALHVAGTPSGSSQPAPPPSGPGPRPRQRSQTSHAEDLRPAITAAGGRRRPLPAAPPAARRARSPSPSPNPRRNSGDKVKRLSEKLSPRLLQPTSPRLRALSGARSPPPVPARPPSPASRNKPSPTNQAQREPPPVPKRGRTPVASKPKEPKPARPMSPKPKKKLRDRFSLFSGKKKDKEPRTPSKAPSADPSMDAPDLSLSNLPEDALADESQSRPLFPYQYSGREGEFEGEMNEFRFAVDLPAPPPFFKQTKVYLSSWGSNKSFGPQPLREAGTKKADKKDAAADDAAGDAAGDAKAKARTAGPGLTAAQKRKSMPPGRLATSRGVSDDVVASGLSAVPEGGTGLNRSKTQAPGAAMQVSPALDAAQASPLRRATTDYRTQPTSPLKQQNPDEVKFQKGDLLGKGGFGRVFRAIDLSTASVFAVKEIDVVKGSAAENKESMDAFQQEVKLMQRLDHPNVVQYLGVQTSERVIRVFLELAQGSLVDIIKKFGGSLHEKVIRKFTMEILTGLEYLHGEGVVHRDIKGSNILMGTDGHLKLADFGASKHYGEIISGQALKSIVGTPFWMAPEVVKEEGYGSKADIWSVGCVIVEMVTGSHPYSELNQFGAIFQISQGNRPPYDAELLSEEGREFLDLCFRVDPSRRPSATELLQHPFLTGLPS